MNLPVIPSLAVIPWATSALLSATQDRRGGPTWTPGELESMVVHLVVNAELPAELEPERVPSFALQTLVENAVQHGAAPRVAPTEVAISATRSSSGLVISVRNSGDGDGTRTADDGTGTGLARLRERLSVLYGGAATLVTRPTASGGYEAVLTVPQSRPGEA